MGANMRNTSCATPYMRACTHTRCARARRCERLTDASLITLADALGSGGNKELKELKMACCVDLSDGIRLAVA